MSRFALLLALLSSAAMLVGCQDAAVGTTRSLGTVRMAEAAATSREVLAQHFSVLPAEAGAQTVIECRPQVMKPKASGLLAISPASRRKTATCRLMKQGKTVVAKLAVQVEEQGRDVYRGMGEIDQNYSGVPNRTPAQEDAATTPRQNDVWRATGRDRRLEGQILAEIHRQLHPPAKPK